jgi:hypothetical protein
MNRRSLLMNQCLWTQIAIYNKTFIGNLILYAFFPRIMRLASRKGKERRVDKVLRLKIQTYSRSSFRF